jgi:glucosamine--fructose-6-phosphate aminotransferase (isomerizing)
MNEIAQQTPRWINGIEPPKELLSANGTQILEIECREQPARLRELIHTYATDPAIRAQLQELRKLAAKSGPVLFIGMGGSFCSSLSGSVMLQSHGRSSFSVDAGEWLHYAPSVWDDAALSILLTTSGESAELVELFKRGKDRPLGLICNNPASTCWNLAPHRLTILAGPEYGNATKTYTNSTAAAIILSSEILGLEWQEDAERVTQSFASDLDRIFAQRADLEAFCRGAANIEIIGRGAAFGGAIMSALCIRTPARVSSTARTSMWMHPTWPSSSRWGTSRSSASNWLRNAIGAAARLSSFQLRTAKPRTACFPSESPPSPSPGRASHRCWFPRR